MTTLIKPAALKPGDTIGIVSPASPIAALCPDRFQRGVSHLEAMGFQVQVAPNATALHGHTAGTIDQRVEDLHQMFAAPNVKAIITTIGGYNSNQLLDRLDYDLIRANPKILMGYSDITALLVGITKKTGLVTFLGPALMPQFGEFDGLHPFTASWFRSVLVSPVAPIALDASGVSISEHLSWDREDIRPRRRDTVPGPSVLKRGQAEGRIVAGNLGTMLAVAGTPYFPDLDGAILCIEDDETESPATVDRYLTQLRLMGAFEKISALVVGRFHPNVKFIPEDSLHDLLLQATEGYDLPIALDFDFGHTDPTIILPQGIRASVSFAAEPEVKLLETAVLG